MPNSTPVDSSAVDPAVAEARSAFQQGIALAKAERWVLALRSLERSNALHPHAITAYNIGYCERQLKHSTRARKMLTKALADHHARGEVELPTDLVAAAETYLREADRQMARVIVTITPGAVTVDGGPLELAEIDGPLPVLLAGTRGAGQPEEPPSFTFEVLVDPGTHVFVLSAKDRADVIAEKNLAPGSKISLELRVPDATERSQPSDRPIEAETSSAEKPNRVPALIAFGVGAAGFGVGTVSGLLAFGKKNDVSQACQGLDPARCTSERQIGNRAADISTAGFIVGGVAAVVGTILFVMAPGSSTGQAGKAVKTDPRIRPVLGGGEIGLEGRF
jgi:hypothetical protein